VRAWRTAVLLALGAAWGCAAHRASPPPELRGRAALLLVAGPEGDAQRRALQAAVPAVAWADVDALRRTLRRNPGLAPEPDALPTPPPPLGRERRLPDPWATALRRYAAVTDARWVVWLQPAPPEGWALRLVDARTGAVLYVARGSDPVALLTALAGP